MSKHSTQPAEEIVTRKFVRFRERNQFTLPNEMVAGMNIAAGDFLEVVQTRDGSLHVTPTLLVRAAGSPEAQHQSALADEDIKHKDYKTFESAEQFMDDLEKKPGRKAAETPAAAVAVARAKTAAG